VLLCLFCFLGVAQTELGEDKKNKPPPEPPPDKSKGRGGKKAKRVDLTVWSSFFDVDKICKLKASGGWTFNFMVLTNGVSASYEFVRTTTRPQPPPTTGQRVPLSKLKKGIVHEECIEFSEADVKERFFIAIDPGASKYMAAINPRNGHELHLKARAHREQSGANWHRRQVRKLEGKAKVCVRVCVYFRMANPMSFVFVFVSQLTFCVTCLCR
jgi:hypothetical protein